MIIENAVISSTQLGTGDSPCFNFWINLDYGGSGQGFGGHALDQWDEPAGRRVGVAYGTEAIMGVLRVVGVDNWEQLPGKSVRVKKTDHFGRIVALGNYLKDEWLDLKELAERMR